MNTINNNNNTKEILEQRLLERQLKATYATKHWLHLVLSILTGGLWLIVWLIVGLRNAAKQEVVTSTAEVKPTAFGKVMQIVVGTVLVLIVIKYMF